MARFFKNNNTVIDNNSLDHYPTLNVEEMTIKTQEIEQGYNELQEAIDVKDRLKEKLSDIDLVANNTNLNTTDQVVAIAVAQETLDNVKHRLGIDINKYCVSYESYRSKTDLTSELTVSQEGIKEVIKWILDGINKIIRWIVNKIKHFFLWLKRFFVGCEKKAKKTDIQIKELTNTVKGTEFEKPVLDALKGQAEIGAIMATHNLTPDDRQKIREISDRIRPGLEIIRHYSKWLKTKNPNTYKEFVSAIKRNKGMEESGNSKLFQQQVLQNTIQQHMYQQELFDQHVQQHINLNHASLEGDNARIAELEEAIAFHLDEIAKAKEELNALKKKLGKSDQSPLIANLIRIAIMFPKIGESTHERIEEYIPESSDLLTLARCANKLITENMRKYYEIIKGNTGTVLLMRDFGGVGHKDLTYGIVNTLIGNFYGGGRHVTLSDNKYKKYLISSFPGEATPITLEGTIKYKGHEHKAKSDYEGIYTYKYTFSGALIDYSVPVTVEDNVNFDVTVEVPVTGKLNITKITGDFSNPKYIDDVKYVVQSINGMEQAKDIMEKTMQRMEESIKQSLEEAESNKDERVRKYCLKSAQIGKDILANHFVNSIKTISDIQAQLLRAIDDELSIIGLAL